MTLIATWNVNSIRTRLPILEKWVAHRNPDIILLQELKCMEETFPLTAMEDLGYNVEMLGQKSYNGVAILSKYPIEDVVHGLPTLSNDPQARYIEAFCGGIRVASVYVPNGQKIDSDKFNYKMNFLKALKKHARALLAQDESLIIGGDYNVAPDLCDGHNPDIFEKNRILCSLQEREALKNVINEGLIDGYRVVHPETLHENQKKFSWWDYRSGSYENNKGYRIDHLYCSPKAADFIQNSGIDIETRLQERPSDHAPVWLSLTPTAN